MPTDDDPTKKMPKSEELQKLEQGSALMADYMPPLWRRLYENCISVGFTEIQSIDLVKTYIISQGIRYTSGG